MFDFLSNIMARCNINKIFHHPCTGFKSFLLREHLLFFSPCLTADSQLSHSLLTAVTADS